MRILNVIQYYSPAEGGAENHIKEVSERLVFRGHTVSVFTSNLFPASPTSFQVPRQEVINGVHVRRFKAITSLLGGEHPSGKKVGTFVPWLARLATSIDTKRPFALVMLLSRATIYPFMPGLISKMLISAKDVDVVTGWQFPWAAPLQAFIAAKVKRVPFVVRPLFHIGRPTYECESFYYVLRKADGVIAQTPYEQNHFLSLGVQADKICVVSRGVELNNEHAIGVDEVRNKYGMGDNFLVLFIGRREFDKGYYHVLCTMAKVWQTTPNVVLILIGRSNSLKSQPKNSREEYTLKCQGETVLDIYKDKIIDLGAPPDDVKREVLSAANVLVVPSRVESLGTVYLEAWASKMPIIAVTQGPASTFVDNGENGFLVDFGDCDTMSERILTLVGNRAKAQGMGNLGYQKVAREFTWDKQIEKLECFYKAICNKHK